jgi:hypothetical protein
MRPSRTIFELFLGRAVFVPIVASLSISLLAGCSASFTPSPDEPSHASIGNIQGAVHGGQAPVTGAQIYLFAAGQGGYGTSATSLMNSSAPGVSCSNSVVSGACYATTDMNGNFTVGSDYACTAGQAVYMVAVGGNPGLTVSPATTTAKLTNGSASITVTSATGINIGMTVTGSGVGGTVTAISGTTVTLSQKATATGSGVSVTFSGVNNTAIVQMAALGQCPTTGGTMASQVPYLVIDEATTVAFAYAVGGFATTAYNVSSDAGGETALANAFANAANIVALSNGQAPTTANGNTNSVNPQTKINALANILANCVNTTNISSTACGNLFTTAKSGGTTGTAATDEASAMFNIAHNSAANVSGVWGLYLPPAIFSPTLPGAPTDWTMPVIYKNVVSTPVTTGGVVTSGPYNIAFDSSGNAWIGDRVNGVIEIEPQGAVTTFTNSANGFGMVKGVAVSPQDGTIWVSDYKNNQVDVMTSSGTTLTLKTTITQDLTSNGPVLTSFALNPGTSGSTYIAYEVNEKSASIVAFDAGGYSLDVYEKNSNYTNINEPGWVTVDNTGSAWFPSTNTEFVGGLIVTAKNGTNKYTTTEPSVGAAYATVPETMGVSSDSSGNIWASASIEGAALYAANDGAVAGFYQNGGLNNPQKTFVDGANVIWVANVGANTVSALNSSTGNWLASNGFATSAQADTGALAVAVDASGDVWVANSDKSVTELLGLATPTASPLYAGSTTTTSTTKGNLGTKP